MSSTSRLSRRLRRVAESLDSVLGEFVGSAQIGPYVPPDPRVRELDPDCPHCGAPISRHETDRGRAIGRLYCPTPISTPNGAAVTDASAESEFKLVT